MYKMICPNCKQTVEGTNTRPDKDLCPNCGTRMYEVDESGKKKKNVRRYGGVSNLWNSPKGMYRFFPFAFKFYYKGKNYFELDVTLLNFRFWMESIP